ncbi:dicarboxylate/amino acid:cation symporter [Vibrio metschnikovii]
MSQYCWHFQRQVQNLLYPKTLESLSAFGTPKRISSFVLPMGYSFNLDGSMMYCTFAVMFIAQAYGIELTMAQQVTMLLILMVTSKRHGGRAPRVIGGDCRHASSISHP